MLQTKIAEPAVPHVRPHPLAPLQVSDARMEVEMVRLARGALARLEPGRPRLIQVTGAGHGVGTSRIVRAMCDALARTGQPTGSFDLSEVPVGDPDLPPLRLPPPSDGAQRVPTAYEDPAFDVVVLDTQPVRLSGLSMSIASTVGGTILVVEAERTTREEIRESIHTIEDCGGRCLGLVLNRRRRSFWTRRRKSR